MHKTFKHYSFHILYAHLDVPDFFYLCSHCKKIFFFLNSFKKELQIIQMELSIIVYAQF